MTMNPKVAVTALALALLAGCATSGGTGGKRQRDPLPDESPGTARTPTSSKVLQEDTTAVFKAPQQPQEPKVSDDQRDEFEKVVVSYQKAKQSGKADCDSASGFGRLADRHPQMLIARHNQAAVYFECGRKQDGMKIWEELGRKGYAPALAQLGYAAWQNGNQSDAERYFTRSVEADKLLGSMSARINLAQILRDKARHSSNRAEKDKYNQDAVTHLRSVLALDGNSLQAYANLCYIYFDLGLPDAAVLVGKQAIKRAQEIATGKFEDEAGGEQAAEKDSGPKKKPAKKGDKDDAAPKRRTLAVVGTGMTPEMKRHIAVVYNTLGLVSLNKKNNTEAIKNFREAVALDPELYEARLNLAAVSLKFRDYGTAEENFRSVLGAQPKNYEANIGLGVAFRGNRKFDEAEQQYMTAQKLDSNRAESYFNLGLLYQEYKGSDKPTLQKAQQHYRDFISRTRDSKMRNAAEKRIKDIDEMFSALAEAAKMQAEAEELQRKAEQQQKEMEEKMKKQEEDEKKKAGGASSSAEPAKTEPATAVAPPPAK